MDKLDKTPLKLFRKKHIQEFASPLKIPLSPMLQKIGYGTGIAVYLMGRKQKQKGASPWAIKKCLKDKVANKTYAKRLEEEASLLKSLSHPNIVGFRAYTQGPDGRFNLAMEACTISLGNLLENRLEANNETPLESWKIQKVGIDISKALKYLHTEAMLLHGDMKSFNILIKGDFAICKLCDFGVAQPINSDGIMDLEKKILAEYTGTELWNAPEVFEEDPSLITTKCDIFSFGMVMYECIVLCPPHTLKLGKPKALDFDNLDENIDDVEEDEEDEDEDLMVGTRPTFPDNMELSDEYNQILEVFFICTDEEPDKRPTSSDLVEMFTEMEEIEENTN